MWNLFSKALINFINPGIDTQDKFNHSEGQTALQIESA